MDIPHSLGINKMNRYYSEKVNIENRGNSAMQSSGKELFCNLKNKLHNWLIIDKNSL